MVDAHVEFGSQSGPVHHRVATGIQGLTHDNQLLRFADWPSLAIGGPIRDGRTNENGWFGVINLLPLSTTRPSSVQRRG